MVIGIDLDNTIICYDGLFYDAAVGQGMMPADGPRDKQGVRDWFVKRGREDDFTLLQGYVYGPGLVNARPYPGALERIKQWIHEGKNVVIVSHKTKKPYRGPEYDLRAAAMDWLDSNGVFKTDMLNCEDVNLELTMDDKARKVANLGCTHFIDDMVKFLTHPLFPTNTARWLFSPSSTNITDTKEYTVFSSWNELIL